MYKRLGHIAIRAKDIEASIVFYRDTLGLKEAFRMYNDEGRLSTVYLCIAPGQFIELFSGGTVRGEFDPFTSAGLVHLCIETADIEETYQTLRTGGLHLEDGIKTGHSKSKLFFISDPDGNRIEFMELTPESLQAQAIARLEADEA